MQLYNYLKPKMQFIGTLVLAFAMFSCGSYQYSGYENDSIYGDSDRTVVYVEEEPTSDNSQYYKNYFKEKTEQYAHISGENDVIFTDIDSYEGDYVEENDTLYYDNYAGWGENNSDITINVYGGHAFNSIWWNRPYFTSWGWNYGYGYGNVWGLGFNNWGWNRPLWLDYGWGWGWNSPFWYGGFYNPPYFYGNNYWYNGGYYSQRALAYNQTRRGATYASNGDMSVIGRRSAVNSSNTSRRTTVGDLNRRTTNRRVIGTNTNTSRNRVGTTNSRTRPTTTRSNTSRIRSNNTTTRSRSTRINNNNSSTRNISRSNNSSSRSNNISRSSSNRSNNMSSRSSSTSRSSTSRRGNN